MKTKETVLAVLSESTVEVRAGDENGVRSPGTGEHVPRDLRAHRKTRYIGQACAFDGTLSLAPGGTIVEYSWGFGDGQQATGAEVSHAFDMPGTYLVVPTVMAPDGRTDKDQLLVFVLNCSQAPVTVEDTGCSGTGPTRGEPPSLFAVSFLLLGFVRRRRAPTRRGVSKKSN